MLKLAGRRVYFAALAVPIAMVIAPLNASAGEPDEAVVTEQVPAAAIATDVDAVDAESNIMTETDEESYEESYEESDEVEFSPGPDWYYESDENSVGNDDDVNTVYVINGIHDDSVIGVHEHDETVVEDEATYENEEAVEEYDVTIEDEDDVTVIYPAHDVDVIEDDYLDESSENDAYGVTYSDVSAGAGPEGAWVSSTESGAVIDGDDFGHALDEDDVAGAYYEEVSAGAGDEGAYVDSIESGAGAFDDEDASAYHEQVAAFAGVGGAWVDSTESAAGELDD